MAELTADSKTTPQRRLRSVDMSLRTLTNDRATGEAYCLAHHITTDGDKRRFMVASLRYHDTFVKIDVAWLFSERRLYVDWIDERPLSGSRSIASPKRVVIVGRPKWSAGVNRTAVADIVQCASVTARRRESTTSPSDVRARACK